MQGQVYNKNLNGRKDLLKVVLSNVQYHFIKGRRKPLKNYTSKLEVHKPWKILNMQSLKKCKDLQFLTRIYLTCSSLRQWNHYFFTDEGQPQLNKCWETLHYENRDYILKYLSKNKKLYNTAELLCLSIFYFLMPSNEFFQPYLSGTCGNK